MVIGLQAETIAAASEGNNKLGGVVVDGTDAKTAGAGVDASTNGVGTGAGAGALTMTLRISSLLTGAESRRGVIKGVTGAVTRTC